MRPASVNHACMYTYRARDHPVPAVFSDTPGFAFGCYTIVVSTAPFFLYNAHLLAENMAAKQQDLALLDKLGHEEAEKVGHSVSAVVM